MDKVVPMSKIAGIHNGSMNIKITNYMAGQPPRMGRLVRPFLFLVKVDCTDNTSSDHFSSHYDELQTINAH